MVVVVVVIERCSSGVIGTAVSLVRGTRNALQKLPLVRFTTHGHEERMGAADTSREEHHGGKKKEKNTHTQKKGTCQVKCNYLHHYL